MSPGPLLDWQIPLPSELGPALRERRRSVAARARGRVLDLGGWSDHLDLYDDAAVDVVELLPDHGVARSGSYDTVVSLLRAPLAGDPTRFVARLRSLLSGTGQLLFLEPGPVAGLGRVLAHAGRLAGAVPGWPVDLDVVAEMRAAGLLVTDIERFRCPTLPRPVRPFVAGRAVHHHRTGPTT